MQASLSTMIIRAAGAGDAVQLGRMRAVSQAEREGALESETVDAYAAECAAFFASALEHDDGFLRAWIAFDGERAAGAAILTVVPTLPRFGARTGDGTAQPRDARVRNVYVAPEYRRLGVGAALVREVIACALRDGIDRLSLGASDMGRPLYESLGFELKEDEMVYRGGSA